MSAGTPQLPPKSPFASKTAWVAFLLFVVSALEWASEHEFVQQYPEVVAYLGMAVAAIMFVLRIISKRPVSLKPNGGGKIKAILLIGLLAAVGGIAYAQTGAEGSAGVTLRAFAPNSSYLLRITTDANGRVSEIARVNPFPVIDINQLPVEDMPDSPPSPIPPGSLRARFDTTIAEINDPETARNLGIGYTVVLSGTYSSVDAIGEAATKVRMDLAGDKRAWDIWGDVLIGELRKAAQEGNLQTPEQYAEILTVARDAMLAASADFAEFGDGRILDLVQKVLTLLENLDGVEMPGIIKIIQIVLALL